MSDEIPADILQLLQKRFDAIDKKLDAVLRSCCTHTRQVASTTRGDPIVCEDCQAVVGVVP